MKASEVHPSLPELIGEDCEVMEGMMRDYQHCRPGSEEHFFVGDDGEETETAEGADGSLELSRSVYLVKETGRIVSMSMFDTVGQVLRNPRDIERVVVAIHTHEERRGQTVTDANRVVVLSVPH